MAHKPTVVVTGKGKFDEQERICTTMQVAPSYGPLTVLPPHCQVWFKLGDVYFISDSDWDRRTRVLSRTVNQ